MNVSDFINKDLIRFSRYDNERSIPHLFDGLKTSQRKILRTALTCNYRIKCNQLGTKAAEQNAYHHNEDAIIKAVIGMGRDFPGSNNVPYLLKDGQFGNILSSESSSPRYIHVLLHENAKKLIQKDDDPILRRQWEEGEEIEPEFYLTPVPMILVNGADGRGTGFASKILPHSYADVSKAVVEYMETGAVQTRLVPAFNGFKGKITRSADDQIVMKGVYEIVNSTTIRITEIPIKFDQDKYKVLLNKLIDQKKVRSYTNRSTEDGWDFEIKVPREITKLSAERLNSMFQLIERRTQVLVAWSDGNIPEKFDNVEAMVAKFCEMRKGLYEERKQSMIEIETANLTWYNARVSFIDYWNEHGDIVRKNPKSVICEHLAKFLPKLDADQIDKLVSLPIYSLTDERRAQFVAKRDECRQRIKQIQSLTIKDLWTAHLKGESC